MAREPQAVQNPRDNTYFTVEQQQYLDELGKRKNTMDFDEWYKDLAEYVIKEMWPGIKRDTVLCDAVTDFLVKSDSFDPEKAPLSHYAQKAISNNKKGRWADIHKDRTITENIIDGDGKVTEQARQRFVPMTVNRDGEEVELELPSDETNNSYRSLIDKLALNQEMAATILRFYSLTTHDKTEKRLRYYKMWFSETTVYSLLKDWPIFNERDTEAAMDFGYVDFFMDEDFGTQQSQNIRNLRMSHPKETVYCNCVSRNIPVDWKNNGWLHAAIPKEYAASWGVWDTGYPQDSEISTCRKEFREEYQERLEQ